MPRLLLSSVFGICRKQYMPLEGSPDEEAPPMFDPKVPLPAIPAHRPEAASSDPPPFEQPAPGPSA